MTTEGKETIRVTPCCKSRHWHFVNRVDLPDSVVRCELCHKLHDFEHLLRVVKGLNPNTFFCDKCHKSTLEEIEELEGQERR